MRRPMPSPKQTYDPSPAPPSLGVKEEQLEYGFIGKLQGLMYAYRPDICAQPAAANAAAPTP